MKKNDCNIMYIFNYTYSQMPSKKCEHGRQKSQCKECGGGSICEHGRIKSQCKECGGGSICEHGRIKSQCKECGGSAFCEHGKRKSTCKECGGSSICEHGKIKSRCKECGGSSICEHGKRKSTCKECGGSSICEHGKIKSRCKECGGSSICEHGKIKSTCKECGGSSICEHGKIKSACKECGGGSICEHGKIKSQCKECGGSSICEHGKFKSKCKECGGSSICEHGKIKSTCKECGGSSICEHGKRKSQCKECGGGALCKAPHCETYAQKKYNGYCVGCCIHYCPEIKVSRNYKTKENEVVHRIKEYFPNFDWIHDKAVKDGCSQKRPDLLLDFGEYVMNIEVDENKHSNYDCSCENKRLMQISQDLQHRPLILLRFNPDAYINRNNIRISSCWKANKLGILQITRPKMKEWEERIDALKSQIQYWIDNKPKKTIEIIELFYE